MSTEDLRRENEGLRARIAELDRELAGQISRVRAALAEELTGARDEALAENIELKGQVTTMNDEIVELRGKVTSLNDRVVQLQAALDQVQERRAAAEAEVESQKSCLAEANRARYRLGELARKAVERLRKETGLAALEDELEDLCG